MWAPSYCQAPLCVVSILLLEWQPALPLFPPPPPSCPSLQHACTWSGSVWAACKRRAAARRGAVLSRGCVASCCLPHLRLVDDISAAGQMPGTASSTAAQIPCCGTCRPRAAAVMPPAAQWELQTISSAQREARRARTPCSSATMTRRARRCLSMQLRRSSAGRGMEAPPCCVSISAAWTAPQS